MRSGIGLDAVNVAMTHNALLSAIRILVLLATCLAVGYHLADIWIDLVQGHTGISWDQLFSNRSCWLAIFATTSVPQLKGRCGGGHGDDGQNNKGRGVSDLHCDS
ncbi:MAG: hypothetical protein J3Q66DRAFT_348764 [Benniella sp.]|nr:MAG: hypothetical protein J3Q66DRAFT_348764 [Benniella sp.]